MIDPKKNKIMIPEKNIIWPPPGPGQKTNFAARTEPVTELGFYQRDVQYYWINAAGEMKKAGQGGQVEVK